jgi:hypothetical protein
LPTWRGPLARAIIRGLRRDHGFKTLFVDDPVVKTLAYKSGWVEIVQRLRRLYERRAADQIFATMTVPSATLREFARQNPGPECEYPDPVARAKFWDEVLAERVGIEDDSLPSAYLSEFDQGLYGGLLGGEVRFMVHPETGWISSMVPPLLADWRELDRLHFEESHPWWQRYCRQLQVFIEQSAGKWGISHFILIDGLNFVFELVGATRTYLGLDECPEVIRRAIDLAFDLNLKVQQHFFSAVPSLAGGTFSNFGQWIPGRIVSESLDPYHMTSVACFEKWGREPAERILGRFDGGVVHLHGNGRHLLPAASSLKGLKAILLLDDRGFPSAFAALEELQPRASQVPLCVFADYHLFRERLERHELPGGVMYQVLNVPDHATANRCMEAVRAYRM